MKKVLIIALALILVLTLAAGCGGNDTNADEGAKKGIDALPADSDDVDDVDVDIDLDFGNLKNMGFIDDEGFAGRADGEEIFAPVNEDWEVVSD
ncbi:MAG: hypothetical protein FWG03_05700 [Clostridiales bacterium]|nr:hypothetical protein [Clostridiales bacterium]